MKTTDVRSGRKRPRRLKIAMASLGCPKNLVDAEVMLGLLREAGHVLTPHEEEADVIIVNTCGFIEPASQESINRILELSQLKETGRLKALIVTGCLAQRYADELAKEMPEVDAVVGTGQFPRIAEIVEQVVGEGGRPVLTEPYEYLYQDEPRVVATPRHYAYVKIAEGCDNRCTYCTIPQIRGRFRSRRMEVIEEEVRRLASQGVKEVILVAQDTTRYGSDIYGECSLDQLISRLARIEGIRWIRSLYAYPSRITPGLLRVLAEEPKAVKYLDIPLQHIDDDVLRRMGRLGSSDHIKRLIEEVRSAVPGVTLRSTFIVGFPGETEEAFQRLLEFLRWARLDRVGVFPYYAEEGTPAAEMEGQIPEEEKERRRHLAMETQREISRANNEKRVGDVVEAIVDGPSEESELVTVVRSQAEAPEIDGVIYVGNAHPPAGEFIKVRLVEAADYDMVGEAVDWTE